MEFIQGNLAFYLPEQKIAHVQTCVRSSVNFMHAAQDLDPSAYNKYCWGMREYAVFASQNFERLFEKEETTPDLVLCSPETLDTAVQVIDRRYAFSRTKVVLVGQANSRTLSRAIGKVDSYFPILTPDNLAGLASTCIDLAIQNTPIDKLIHELYRKEGPYRKLYELTRKPTGSVLIVSDNHINLEGLLDLLGAFYEIKSSSLATAARMCPKELERYDCIVIDNSLVKPESVEALRILYDTGKALPHNCNALNNEVQAIFIAASIQRHKLSRITLSESANYQATAFYDSLTGLPNRDLCHSYLSDVFNSQDDQKLKTAFAFLLDLDHFGIVNNSYGHDAGDTVLRKWGEILKKSARITTNKQHPTRIHTFLTDVYGGTDLICRFGGEEFFGLSYHQDRKIADTMLKRMRRALNDPIEVIITEENYYKIKDILSNSGYLVQNSSNPNRWEVDSNNIESLKTTPYCHLRTLEKIGERGPYRAYLQITFSAGMAPFNLSLSSDQTIEGVFSHAARELSATLKKAKLAGRDRVFYAPMIGNDNVPPTEDVALPPRRTTNARPAAGTALTVAG